MVVVVVVVLVLVLVLMVLVVGYLRRNLGWVGVLVCSLFIKSIPTQRQLFAVGKSGPNAAFTLIFLGLGWPWVGEFVGFMIIFNMLFNPTEFGRTQTPY